MYIVIYMGTFNDVIAKIAKLSVIKSLIDFPSTVRV